MAPASDTCAVPSPVSSSRTLRASDGRNYGAALISSLLLPRAIAAAKLRLCETALPRSLAPRSIKNNRASCRRRSLLAIHFARYLRPLIISTRKRVQSRINPRSAAAETSNSIRSRAFPSQVSFFLPPHLDNFGVNKEVTQFAPDSSVVAP